MFPVDDGLPDDVPTRLCPDCHVLMRIAHQGKFITLYVCPKCGVSVTVPPKLPAMPR